MENAMIFAKRLKELRGKMTQGQLGELLGVSRGSVSFYENGERTPDADFIIKAAKYFGISTDYLLGMSDIQVNKGQDVLEETGLSGESLKTLYDINKIGYSDTLNKVINTSSLFTALDALHSALIFLPSRANEDGMLVFRLKNDPSYHKEMPLEIAVNVSTAEAKHYMMNVVAEAITGKTLVAADLLRIEQEARKDV